MIFLEKDDLGDVYQTAKNQAGQWFKNFPEFERLADNKIRSDLPKNMPRVNDGSLAALLIEAPNSILNGQRPSGTVKVIDRDEAWLAELANIEWQSEITKKANTQADFDSKNLQVIQKALTYGSQPTVDMFTQRGNYIGADFYLPYIGDVLLEPGKVSDYDSEFIFVNTWYTKLQIKNIIQKAKDDAKQAREEGRENFNPWDLKALQEVLDAGEQKKDQYEQNKSERDGKSEASGIKLVAVYQRGVDAPFYMMTETGKCVRTWKNQDPTGDVPVHFMYCHQDFTNPYGKGKVELAGGTQNVLDYTTQANVLAMQMGLQPPIGIRGRLTSTNLNSMVFAPNQKWFLGDANVEPIRTTNETFQNIANFYGLTKSQLMNMIGRTDGGSVSAEAGNPQFSKTSAGVKAQAGRTDLNDSALWKNFSIWFEANAKSMINIHFANMQGTDIRKLLDDEKERLIKAAPEEFAVLQDTNELEVIWDNTRAQFEFEVDSSSNEIKDEEKQIEVLSTITQQAIEDPSIVEKFAALGWKFDPGEAQLDLYRRLGVENNKILVKMEVEDGAVGEEGMQTEEDPDVPMEIQGLMEEFAVDEQTATTAHQYIQQGAPREKVLEFLQSNQPQDAVL